MITDEILPFIAITAPQDCPPQINADVKLSIRNTTIKSPFVDNKRRGIFADKSIPAYTYVMKLEKESLVNDGVVNLKHIINAQNNVEMYNAWNTLFHTYYTMSKIKRVINVRMVKYNNDTYLQTISNVPVGSELLRLYGFTTWPFEILDILTHRTVVGFAYFIDKLTTTLATTKSDPLYDKIVLLNEALHTIIPDYTQPLHYYDSNNSTNNNTNPLTLPSEINIINIIKLEYMTRLVPV